MRRDSTARLIRDMPWNVMKLLSLPAVGISGSSMTADCLATRYTLLGSWNPFVLSHSGTLQLSNIGGVPVVGGSTGRADK